MEENNNRPQRRSIRLKEYDYSKGGAYFVTICVHDGAWLFGEFKNDEVVLNDFGKVVEEVWLGLPKHYLNVILDEYIIMPNHFHGIIFLKEVEGWQKNLNNKNLVGAGFKPARWSEENESFKNENTLDAEKRAGYKPAPTEKDFKNVRIHALPEIIRGFKTFSAKEINKLRNTKGTPVWQRNYYEHIIRSETSLADIRQYISENPQRWLLKHQKNNETI
jgi:REP element-mobilizing transposase RayT